MNPQKGVPLDIAIIYDPTDESKLKSNNRCYRDISMLLKEFYKHPDDYRLAYFLGQSYCNLKEFEKAAQYYLKAIKNSSAAHDKAEAYYKLAQQYELLKDWQKAERYYLDSYNTYPSKAEPLIRIANHCFFAGDLQKSYDYALKASNIPCPHSPIVEKHLYNVTRHDILSAAAWHLGQYEIGQKAVEEALKSDSENEPLKKRLQLFINKQHELATMNNE